MSNRITFPKKLPTVERMADLLMGEAMERSGGDIGAAAGMLGISPARLKRRLEKADGRMRLRKAVLNIFTLFFLLLSAARSNAEINGFNAAVSTLSFTSGAVTAYAFHELGHLGAAWATGTYIKFEPGTYNQPIGFTEDADSDSDGTILTSAGLVTQAIGSEIILESDGINKNSTFIRGMMAWNIINPISYAIDYWFIHRSNKKFKNSYQGDIQGIEFYSGKRTANAFSVGIVAVSLVQGYRFLKTQTWMGENISGKLDYLKNINLSPVYEGGIQLSYIYKF